MRHTVFLQTYFAATFTSIIFMCIYESIISTLLVAVYMFVSIRLDPFGTRNIITTPRCVATCVGTWVFSGSLAVLCFKDLIDLSYNLVNSVVLGLVLTNTSACYMLIYYGVSKIPCTDNVQLLQRKAENKKVLRTFGLILGTSVACWLLPLVYWIMRANNRYDVCMRLGTYLMIAINWCANSLIYWWRLKEFRSVFTCCRGRRIAPGAPGDLVV